jgi:hypothetical protein
LGCPAQQKIYITVLLGMAGVYRLDSWKNVARGLTQWVTFSQDVGWVKGDNEPGKDCFFRGKGNGNHHLVRGICNGFLWTRRGAYFYNIQCLYSNESLLIWYCFECTSPDWGWKAWDAGQFLRGPRSIFFLFTQNKLEILIEMSVQS